MTPARKMGEEVVVIHNGHHRGKIIARTYEENPLYDVRTEKGKIFYRVPEEELR